MRKFSIVVLGAAVLVAAGSLMVHFNPQRSLSLCGEQTIVEKTSPDGRYVAVLMHRNCGTTLGRNAHINLRLASAPRFRRRFLGGPINDGEIFGTSKVGVPEPRFCWSSPRRLEIDNQQKIDKTQPLGTTCGATRE